MTDWDTTNNKTGVKPMAEKIGNMVWLAGAAIALIKLVMLLVG